MENNITFETLWQICKKEKQSNELQQLPKTFYTDVMSFINGIRGESFETKDSELKENTIKLTSQIFDRRKQKILIYIAYNKLLPQPAIESEQEFYNDIIKLTNENSLDHIKERKQSSELKALEQVPEIILPSGNKLGPLEKGQIINLEDRNDMEFLIKNQICETR